MAAAALEMLFCRSFISPPALRTPSCTVHFPLPVSSLHIEILSGDGYLVSTEYLLRLLPPVSRYPGLYFMLMILAGGWCLVWPQLSADCRYIFPGRVGPQGRASTQGHPGSQPSTEQEQQQEQAAGEAGAVLRTYCGTCCATHLCWAEHWIMLLMVPAAWLQPRTSVQAKEFCPAPAPAPNEGRCGVCSVVCCGRDLSGEIFGFSLPQIMDWLPRPRSTHQPEQHQLAPCAQCPVRQVAAVMTWHLVICCCVIISPSHPRHLHTLIWSVGTIMEVQIFLLLPPTIL